MSDAEIRELERRAAGGGADAAEALERLQLRCAAQGLQGMVGEEVTIWPTQNAGLACVSGTLRPPEVFAGVGWIVVDDGEQIHYVNPAHVARLLGPPRFTGPPPARWLVIPRQDNPDSA